MLAARGEGAWRAGGRRPLAWVPRAGAAGTGGGWSGPEAPVKDGPQAREARVCAGSAGEKLGARGGGRGAGATCGLCGGT